MVISIELEGKSLEPREVPGWAYGRPGEVYRENFPLFDIDGKIDKYRPETWPPPLAAEEGWFEEPLAPRANETPITFVIEGEDAKEALDIIRMVMLAPYAPTIMAGYNRTMGEAWMLDRKIRKSWDGRGERA